MKDGAMSLPAGKELEPMSLPKTDCVTPADATEAVPAPTGRKPWVATVVALGHSRKLVAYERGLVPATVSELARAALCKLGVRSRGAMVQLFDGARS
jgi:DNA-binding NarL/FixJ family response regulator